MALTASQLALATFGAAVGGYKTTIDSFVTANGEAAAINALIAGSSLNGLANGVFATKLVDLLIGSSASTTTKNLLANAVEANLNGGTTKAALVSTLVNALASSTLAADATWGAAATQFQNRVTVSDYYAGKTSPSTDLTTLTNIANQVTSTAASVTAAKASIDSGVAGYNSFTLTNATTGDTPALTSNNDVITAAVGSLNTADVLVDTSVSDNDILNATINAYAAGTTPTVSNIETLNIVGQYASTGLALTNVIGAKTLNLSAGVVDSTATVIDAAANKAATIVAGSNIGNLNITAGASGTSGTVTVNGGSASNVTVLGGAGNDTFVVSSAAGTTLTVDGAAGTADAITLNLSGGARTLANANNGDIETLTLNSTGSANTVTISHATNDIVGIAAGNKAVVTGDQNLTLVGDLDTLTGLQVAKSAFTGTLTVTSNVAATAANLQGVAADVVNIGTTATGSDVTVNQDSTLHLLLNNGARTYNIDNAASDLAATGGTLHLVLDTTTAQTSVTTGAKVATLDLSASVNTSVATLVLNALTTVVSVSGSKNISLGTTAFTNAGNEVVSASALTGNLTFANNAAAVTVIGGSGADNVTFAGAFASVGRGGDGNDVINGSTGADKLYGDAGNDFLVGNGGADTILGGAGDDTINGGAGADVLTGGDGNDTFVITDTGTISATVFDTITDWSAGDKLNFGTTALAAVAHTTAAVAGTASISATGLASFNSADTTLADRLTAVVTAVGTDAAGTAVAFTSGSDTYVFVVGDATAGIDPTDMLIKLTGVSAATGLTFNGAGDIITIA